MRPSRILLEYGLALLVLSAGCSPADPQAPRQFLYLSVAPEFASLSPGDTLQLAAAVTTTGGAPVPGVPVRWSSTDPWVAEVSPSGMVLARGRGTVDVAAAGAGSEAVMTVSVEREPLPGLLVIAHRGFAAVFPENTLVAVNGAFDRGADAVEVDVWVARDGEFIVMHDSTVDRTTNGTGRVADLTSVQLRALDACSKKGAHWGSCPVPSALDVLRAARGRGLVVLDLKGRWSGESCKRLRDLLAAEEMRSSVILAHPDASFLSYWRWLDPRLKLGRFSNRRVPVDSIVRTEAMAGLVLYTALADDGAASYGSALRAGGSALGAWTIDSPTRAAALRARGVDWLISDVPLDRAALDTITVLP